MYTKYSDLIARLSVAAGLEDDGSPREELDEAADDETKALAKKRGSYTAALEVVCKAEREEEG